MHLQKDTVLIVNPNSKSGLTGKNWDSLFKTLSKAFGDNVEVAFTKKPGDGTTIARHFLRKGFKNIIPIGGDGMINEVGNGFFEPFEINTIFNDEKDNNLSNKNIENNDDKTVTSNDSNDLPPLPPLKPINPDAIMTILPCGTRNVLVKSLDLPAEVEECCNRLGNSKTTRKIDVISAIVTDSNNPSKHIHRVFFNAAEMGMGAEVIEKAKETRKKINSRFLSTLTGLITTVSTFESGVCNISINKQDVGKTNGNSAYNNLITKMTMGVIANGRYLGGGFQGAPNASVSDGLLDMFIVKDSDALKMIDELINMKVGDISNQSDDIFYVQAKNIEIKPGKDTNLSVTVDGEPIGKLPAYFEVHPNILTIRS